MPLRLIVLVAIFIAAATQAFASNFNGGNFTFAGQELGVSTYDMAMTGIPGAKIKIGSDPKSKNKRLVATGKFKFKSSITATMGYDSENRLNEIIISAPKKLAREIFDNATKGQTKEDNANIVKHGNGMVEYIKPGTTTDQATIKFTAMHNSPKENDDSGLIVISVALLAIFAIWWRARSVRESLYSRGPLLLNEPENYVMGEFEKQITNIPITHASCSRIIMLGNPDIKSTFFIMARSTGDYKKNQLQFSSYKAGDLYIKSAKHNNMQAHKVIIISCPTGMFSSDNYLFVVVGGDAAMIDVKLKEIGRFLRILQENNFIEPVKLGTSGNFVLSPKGKFLSIKSSRPLCDLVSLCQYSLAKYATGPRSRPGAAVGSVALSTGGYTDHDNGEAQAYSSLSDQNHEWGQQQFQPHHPSVNPANGLPMINDVVDVQGNAFGTDNTFN